MSKEGRKFVEQFMFETLGAGMEIHCYQKLKEEIIEDIIEDSLDSEENGIKNPFWGIVSFKPFTCFYAK